MTTTSQTNLIETKYDELYDYVLNYVAMPIDNKRRACLILGAVMEWIEDCQDAGIDLNKDELIDVLTDIVDEKLGQNS